jgi:hypothetical protein
MNIEGHSFQLELQWKIFNIGQIPTTLFIYLSEVEGPSSLGLMVEEVMLTLKKG